MTAPQFEWPAVDPKGQNTDSLIRLMNTRFSKLSRSLDGKQSRLGWVNVQDSGAAGDGLHDDTAAITKAIGKLTTGSVLFFPPGRYRISGVPTLHALTDVTVLGYGAVLELHGVGSYGFKLTGMHTRLTIAGFDILCDGVLANDHTGIGTATIPGAGNGGTHLTIRDVTVRNAVRGIYLDVGVTYDWWAPVIDTCKILTTVGTASGQGYGIVLSGCRYGIVRNCYTEYTTRHGLYISAGDDHLITGNTLYRHRHGIGTNNTVGALEIARCSRVTAVHNTMVECEDNAMDVRPDETATRISRNILVAHNTFLDSTWNDLVVGNSSPSTSGAFQGIVIQANLFIRSSSPTNIGYALRVLQGLDVAIRGNRFDGDRNYTITIAPIYLSAAEGASYTDRVVITDNDGLYTATGAGYVGFVELGAALCTGSQDIRIMGNTVTVGGGAGSALMIYDAVRTSTTLQVWNNSLDDPTTVVGPTVYNRGPLQAFGQMIARRSTYSFSDYFDATDGAKHAYFGLASAGGGAFLQSDFLAFYEPGGTQQMVVDGSGRMSVTTEYRVNGTKVVAARDTGWTAMSNTADKSTAFDTATVTLPQLAARVKSLQDALAAHGLIGT